MGVRTPEILPPLGLELGVYTDPAHFYPLASGVWFPPQPGPVTFLQQTLNKLEVT